MGGLWEPRYVCVGGGVGIGAHICGAGVEGLGPAELQEPEMACGDWGARDGVLLASDPGFPQRLAELLLEREPAPLLPEAPARIPPEGPSHHLALQLANSKAQLRRLRQEL